MPGIHAADAGDIDNSPIIERILALRQEKAGLLGFENFAQLSMASKVRCVSCRCGGCISTVGLRSQSAGLSHCQLLGSYSVLHRMWWPRDKQAYGNTQNP